MLHGCCQLGPVPAVRFPSTACNARRRSWASGRSRMPETLRSNSGSAPTTRFTCPPSLCHASCWVPQIPTRKS